MANENEIRSVPKKAAADLSSYQYYGVYLSAADTVNVGSGFVYRCTGVLRNKPSAAGHAAEVVRAGECPVILGENVTYGQRLMMGAAGTFIVALPGWPAYAIAQESGSSGEAIKAQILCEGGGSYTLSP